MFILGINAFHGDSSACLIKNGEIIAAAEEERFRRIKHWAGFPSKSIEYCLAAANISLAEVGHVAVNQDSKANLSKKITYTLTKRPDLGFVLDRIRNKRERDSLEVHLEKAFPNNRFQGNFHTIEHHMAHLSSGFHVSPFEDAVVVSVDGFGDFASAAWGIGHGSDIEVEDKVYFPHSLGIFYQALTQYLGFPHYGDEYKVMGLAPYGKPVFMDEMRKIVLLQPEGSFKLNLSYFRHHQEKVKYEWDNGSPVVGNLLSSGLEDLLGPSRQFDQPLEQKHKDIARSVQTIYEEAFFHLLKTLHARHQVDAVAVAGGCGMNSVANGKIRRKSPFNKVYIQSAAGDAGGAIGAAFTVWHQLRNDNQLSGITNTNVSKETGKPVKQSRKFFMDHAYWGPSFTNDEVAVLLESEQKALQEQHCEVLRFEGEKSLCEKTANCISEGLVVGWFQGRMEWGPRALGNRSIVCDPRRADMKDILNLKIKRRESFRPFAPSILREHCSAWFEEDDEVPFMMKVFQIREQQRQKIPSVTHADGSGRLQTVYKQTNPRYYALIEAFYRMTDVPMVLNTSFNENEPVVCRPEEALDCFLRTKMDILVMEDFMIIRSQ